MTFCSNKKVVIVYFTFNKEHVTNTEDKVLLKLLSDSQTKMTIIFSLNVAHH